MDTKKLRQKILDLAIRGKLVPQDPNDEPASVLLERIRAEKERLIKEGKIKRSKKSASDDEIEAPFEIPESWIACKLEDIAYIGTGATPDTRNNDYYYGNIPWVTSSCTKYDYIDTPTSYITQKAIDETNCRIYPKGTLIMAMYGEGKTRGQISELKIDAATNQACAAIVPYNISTAQYIKLYLKRSYLHIREQAEGGTQPNLNLSKIAQYDIYLPPLSEQKRIINEIERWFTLIDELESNEGDLLKAIDKTKSKILDLAIHGKLVPQDPNDEPAIDLLKRINPKFEACDNESDTYKLPGSWSWSILKNVCSDFIVPQRDKPTRFDGNIPWCRIEDIEGKYLNGSLSNQNVSMDLIKEMNMRICPIGTVLCSCSASLGIQAITTVPCCTNQTFIGIVPNKDIIYKDYLFYFLKSLSKLFYELGTGTTIKYISRTKFEELYIPLPPYQEQLHIVAKIEELFAVLDSIKESLEA